MAKDQPCSACDGTGSVWLEMLESLYDFYGEEEIRREIAEGAVIKTVFRCDECGGTGKVR
jgi:hypothetical protein